MIYIPFCWDDDSDDLIDISLDAHNILPLAADNRGMTEAENIFNFISNRKKNINIIIILYEYLNAYIS